MGSYLKSLRRWASLIAVAAVLLAGVVAMIALGREVVADLEAQRASVSDNLQFTLAQVEVDYLTFKNVVDTYQGRDGELEELRRRFDIFYSRIFTLQQGRQLAKLRAQESWNTPLMRVAAWQDEVAVLMDGPKEDLLQSIEQLRVETSLQRADVRSLSIVALSFFAENSDAARTQTAQTLLRLARLIFGLFVVLLGLSLFLLLVNRKMVAREVTLEQTNQRMNKILSTALDGVVVADKHGRVTEFNPAAEAIFGYSASYAKGRSIGDLIVPDHLREAHDNGMIRMQSGGARHVIGKGRVKMEAKRSNGQTFPVEIALQTAIDRGEEIVIGFIRDISLRVANEQELIEARDRALAGEQAKADFLTVMSHEIRTPLNGLLGNLSLLQETDFKEEQGRLVRNMDISGKVLLNHVDSVLDIARFEAGKMAVVAAPVDLSALLQEIVDGQSGNASNRGNKIAWQWVGRARPHVTTDEQRLRQIFLNLVGNAIKFTDGGSVLIEAEVSEMVPGSDRAMFEFRVIDNGLGIAEADQSRIFKDFETVDPSIERTVEGTGLGLAISYRLVKLLGGEIGVESILGEGSVFWLRLPMELRSAFLVPTDQAEPSKPIGPLDILVVEDNQINLELVQTMLERDGHRVVLAANGAAGVDEAAKSRFDVIFMDISMPIMDGLTAARNIRSGDGASCETPIIALSANVLPDAVSKIREAEMNAFLGKPISVFKIREALVNVQTRPWVDGSAFGGKSTFDEARLELGEDRFWRLLAAFQREMDMALERGEALDWMDEDAVEAYRQECHRLAGSAAVFGLADLRVTLQALEHIQLGVPDQAEQRVKRFRSVWQRDKATIETGRSVPN